MLADLGGKPMVVRVAEQALASKATRVVIATDHADIAQATRAAGIDTLMTRVNHASGTDRLAEAAVQLGLTDETIVVNVQGDEPLIDPTLIDALAQALTDDPQLHMVTAANPLDPADPAVSDPNVVKVVLKQNGHALYFSRSPLPFFRNPVPGLQVLRHKGIYGYRRDFLEIFVTWPPSPLEQAESLEQLRALENGANIRVLITDDTSPGVDTPEQALAVERLLNVIG
jgi:3-deoxy-manno-octulosonate cytidylyltransferase (CMP-KDO synthetase)